MRLAPSLPVSTETMTLALTFVRRIVSSWEKLYTNFHISCKLGLATRAKTCSSRFLSKAGWSLKQSLSLANIEDMSEAYLVASSPCLCGFAELVEPDFI